MYDKAFTPTSAMFHKVFRRQALVKAFKREGNCGDVYTMVAGYEFTGP